jgi:hypothetical protein
MISGRIGDFIRHPFGGGKTSDKKLYIETPDSAQRPVATTINDARRYESQRATMERVKQLAQQVANQVADKDQTEEDFNPKKGVVVLTNVDIEASPLMHGKYDVEVHFKKSGQITALSARAANADCRGPRSIEFKDYRHDEGAMIPWYARYQSFDINENGRPQHVVLTVKTGTLSSPGY